MLHRLFMTATISILAATASPAMTQEPEPAAFDPGVLLLANIRAGSTAETYLGNLLAAHRAADSDGNGLDNVDVARMDKRDTDRLDAEYQTKRGELEANMRKADANGDGGVSEAELRAATGGEQRGPDGIKALLEHLDQNRDAQLTVEEFAQILPKPVPPTSQRRRDQFAHVFALDPNRDGTLTEAELTAVFRDQFARIDSDGDGAISGPEFGNARRQIEMAYEIAGFPTCAVPLPAQASRAVAFAAGQGQLLSAVAVGGEDSTTSILDVVIEPGKTPLYVMLSATAPIIWDVHGDVDRIERLVIFSTKQDEAGHAVAAVTGVPESKVFFAAPQCFPAHRAVGPPNRARAKASLIFGATTGIAAEAAALPGGASSVTMPSIEAVVTRKAIAAPAGFDPDVWWWDVAGSWPRGVGYPDPGKIVSPTSVKSYDQLPGAVGLAKLTAEGVIAPTQNYDEFRIVKPLARFPGGLGESGSVSFVLGEGLSMPAGKAGRGCIYSPSGAVVVANETCHRSPRSDAVQVRDDEKGKPCLFRFGGKKVGCFPEDGRPLQPVDKPKGQRFEAAKQDEPVTISEAPAVPTMPMQPVIEIIPAGLRQTWQ